MKTYEKPRLMALSLSGNDRLCGDCAGGITLGTDEYFRSLLEMLLDWNKIGNKNGKLDRDDFYGATSTQFSEGDACKDPVIGNAYCKFTYSTVIVWS